jgi:DNA modification methylase
MDLNKIHHIDASKGVYDLQHGSINCCVSSIPYYGLRDYGVPKTMWPEITYSLFGFDITIPEMECCLGLEKTPKEFVAHIVHIYRGIWNALADDGTNWLNIGDSYAAAGKNRTEEQACRKSNLSGSKGTQISCSKQPNKIVGGVKAKDMLGIPWMVAFALRSAGWYLRQDIIWHKPNPMPESVTDRCTKAHEYIFLLTKSNKYFFDQKAILQPLADTTEIRLAQNLSGQRPDQIECQEKQMDL